MTYLIDLLFIIGVLLIVVPVFILSVYTGCFLVGAILILFAVTLTKKEKQKGGD